VDRAFVEHAPIPVSLASTSRARFDGWDVKDQALAGVSRTIIGHLSGWHFCYPTGEARAGALASYCSAIVGIPFALLQSRLWRLAWPRLHLGW
jgi:hypothetical protein